MSKISDDELIAILCIHSECVGSRSLLKLKERFGSYSNARRASFVDLMRTGLTERQVRSIVDKERQKLINKLYKIVNQLNIKIRIHGEDDFPERLKHISDPPAVLYYRGELPDFRPLSIVGTRRPTSYGLRATRDIVGQVAPHGVTIVSGLAYGIDAMAHKTAVEAKGLSVGVLAHGIERIYPVQHYDLAQQMIDLGGGVVTEFPLLTPAYKNNFTMRNRIIAGFSPLTVVAEADMESGAMSTAAYAREYSRDVWGVPGDVYREMSAGPNSLLRRGGCGCVSANDIIDYFNIKLDKPIQAVNVDEDEEGIIAAFPREGVHIDKVAEALALDIVELSSKVIMLELKGVIRHEGAGVYRRII